MMSLSRCHPEVSKDPEVSRGIVLLAMLAAFSACSGNFSSGTQGNPIPPGGNANSTTSTTGSATPGAKGSSAPTSPGTGVYPLADAANGFACPETTPGYSCQLQFNVPPPTPTPAPTPASRKRRPPPTASPSPSPTASPTPNASASPAASASPGASAAPAASTADTIMLNAVALPKTAPAMVHVPKNALNVVALMMVTITTTADFPLNGLAIAQFTLPKEQIGGRGFALQLFLQRTQGKSKSYAPLLSLDKSSLQKDSLIFGFMPPKITVSKGNTYVLVLYGTDISASSAPSASASLARTQAPSPRRERGADVPGAEPGSAQDVRRKFPGLDARRVRFLYRCRHRAAHRARFSCGCSGGGLGGYADADDAPARRADLRLDCRSHRPARSADDRRRIILRARTGDGVFHPT